MGFGVNFRQHVTDFECFESFLFEISGFSEVIFLKDPYTVYNDNISCILGGMLACGKYNNLSGASLKINSDFSNLHACFR